MARKHEKKRGGRGGKGDGRKASGSRDASERSGRRGGQPTALRFSAVNAVLGVAGLLSVVLGYVLLAGGSITAAPLLLVLGYVVLLPLAVIL